LQGPSQVNNDRGSRNARCKHLIWPALQPPAFALVRESGLKRLTLCARLRIWTAFALVRGRGLKLQSCLCYARRQQVRLRAGRGLKRGAYPPRAPVLGSPPCGVRSETQRGRTRRSCRASEPPGSVLPHPPRSSPLPLTAMTAVRPTNPDRGKRKNLGALRRDVTCFTWAPEDAPHGSPSDRSTSRATPSPLSQAASARQPEAR
jgi:hypothetical protein